MQLNYLDVCYTYLLVIKYVLDDINSTVEHYLHTMEHEGKHAR